VQHAAVHFTGPASSAEAGPEPSLRERLACRRRPHGLPAGYQEWRRLLFLHWPLPPEVVRPLVPPSLSLDLFEGAAYLSLTPFLVQCARPLGVPRRLGLTFLETNVRTYVHIRGRQPGVYFLSLDSTSLISVLGARSALGLPYIYAHGRERRAADGVDYRIRREAGGRPECHVRYRVGGPLEAAEPGTLDYFLIERYLLHVQRGPTLWAVRVNHHPYPLQQVRVLELEDALVQADGVRGLPAGPLAHFSPGVDVAIFPPTVRRLA
jgi:uncharacterized protein